MDILKMLKEKVQQIPEDKKDVGFDSVITHIERAELLLEMGKERNDEHLFTDVIYRTNHAFEGILKEAYKTLTNLDSSNVTTYNIEEYLLSNKVLNERVLDLFKNYRKNWRNASTHDYNLFFSQDEAFLAIVTVTAFINILLKQIIEKFYFNKQKEEIEKAKLDSKNVFINYENMNLFDELQSILLKFQSEVSNQQYNLKSEFSVIGALLAYISSIDSSLKIVREPMIFGNSKVLHPDFLIEKGDEKVLLELKTSNKHNTLEAAMNQVSTYMTESNIKYGLALIVSPHPKVEFVEKHYKYEDDLFRVGGVL